MINVLTPLELQPSTERDALTPTETDTQTQHSTGVSRKELTCSSTTPLSGLTKMETVTAITLEGTLQIVARLM